MPGNCTEILGIEFLDTDIVEGYGEAHGPSVSVISDEEEDKVYFLPEAVSARNRMSSLKDEIFLTQKNIIGIHNKDPASLWDAVRTIFWRISQII